MATFDGAAYTRALASLVGVPARSVQLRVTTASVRVVAAITPEKATAAEAIVLALESWREAGTGALSAQLGHTVVHTEAPFIVTVSSSTPPAQPASLPPGASQQQVTAGDSGAGTDYSDVIAPSLICAAFIVVLIALFYYNRRHLRWGSRWKGAEPVSVTGTTARDVDVIYAQNPKDDLYDSPERELST